MALEAAKTVVGYFENLFIPNLALMVVYSLGWFGDLRDEPPRLRLQSGAPVLRFRIHAAWKHTSRY